MSSASEAMAGLDEQPPGVEDLPEAAPSNDPAEELARLLTKRRLTPAQRRIGQHLLEQPAEVAALGSGELAERAGVSQPSVSRFAQALGFEGYPALRRWLRRFLAGHPLDLVASEEGDRLHHAFVDEHANLRALEEHLSRTGDLTEAGRLLAASSVVVVLGLRASAPLAQLFGFFAAKVHPHVRVLAEGGTPGIDALYESADAGATAMLAMALPRIPRETTRLIGIGRELGLSIVVVTESRLHPAARPAQLVLPVRVGRRLLFDSQAAPTILTTALLQAMADAAPDRSQPRLEAFERRVEVHSFFEPQ